MSPSQIYYLVKKIRYANKTRKQQRRDPSIRDAWKVGGGATAGERRDLKGGGAQKQRAFQHTVGKRKWTEKRGREGRKHFLTALYQIDHVLGGSRIYQL